MGKRFIFILMACSLLSIATVVHAQHIDKQTYTFAIKKADTLKLDKYVMIDQIQGTQSKPVILFAFGGGFKGGRRDNPDYISYFHFLARAGYMVVSTDYRTQLKDIDKSEYSDLQGFSSALQQAITCAVEDFGDATNYIPDDRYHSSPSDKPFSDTQSYYPAEGLHIHLPQHDTNYLYILLAYDEARYHLSVSYHPARNARTQP